MAKGLHYNWMYTVVPYAAIGSGLSIVIPLLILSLKGTVYDVGVAIAAYYLVSVPSSIIWGRLVDKLGRMKIFILLSLLGTLPVILILYIAGHVAFLEFDYGLYALMATAASPAINILVMGTRVNPSLPKYFSKYSIMSIIGGIIAYFAGLFVAYHTISYYLDFLLGLNVIALAMAYILVKKMPKRALSKERLEAAHRAFPILRLISALPHLMTGMPLIEKIHKSLRKKRTRSIYTLLIAVALFNLGSVMFNTAYVPYLRYFGITYSNIFLINVINGIAQLLIYAVVLYFVTQVVLKRYYTLATITRSVSYFVAIIPIFVFTSLAFQINIIAYFIAGLAYAYWNISSSVVVYNHVRGRHKGYYIGMWVALLGLSAIIGAFGSGTISAAIGYQYTFSIAILLNIISIAIFRKCY
ncbi:MAG TPA: MFS transporter [Candidatus Acidoferrum sp.]|nr:MFS transporter [Candidatus Acidoferrum sp.]